MYSNSSQRLYFRASHPVAWTVSANRILTRSGQAASPRHSLRDYFVFRAKLGRRAIEHLRGKAILPGRGAPPHRLTCLPPVPPPATMKANRIWPSRIPGTAGPFFPLCLCGQDFSYCADIIYNLLAGHRDEKNNIASSPKGTREHRKPILGNERSVELA